MKFFKTNLLYTSKRYTNRFIQIAFSENYFSKTSARIFFLSKSFKVSISSCFLIGLLDYLPLVSWSKIDGEREKLYSLSRKEKNGLLQIYHYYESSRNRITDLGMIYTRIIDPYKGRWKATVGFRVVGSTIIFDKLRAITIEGGQFSFRAPTKHLFHLYFSLSPSRGDPTRLN